MSTAIVELSELSEYILQIRMQDRENKNTFSEAMIEGLMKAFHQIHQLPQYKVVILTGYDSYFSSGGTKEGLHFFSDGKGKFSDRDLYSQALNCPIPVIAAMQGHGVGGGFVLGMFCDFVILSRESIYTANFMKYGFTPGMGATLVLPRKLGDSLAFEMMMTAKTYRGEELQKRGISFPVLPRFDVQEYALNLAKNLAEKPKISLMTLKKHLTEPIREVLPIYINKEEEMHEQTFHQPEVKTKIDELFGQ